MKFSCSTEQRMHACLHQVAFFVGARGSADGIDTFVAQVRTAGFGTGGVTAEVDVLARVVRVCAAWAHVCFPAPCDSSENGCQVTSSGGLALLLSASCVKHGGGSLCSP